MSEQKKILNYNTLPEMFFKQVKENSFKPLLWFKKNNKYCSLTWKNIENKIALKSKNASPLIKKRHKNVENAVFLLNLVYKSCFSLYDIPLKF